MELASSRRLPYDEEKIGVDLIAYVKTLIKELEDLYEDIASNINSGSEYLYKDSSPPTTSSDPGVKGEIRWDDTYLYLCTDTDTWVTFKKDGSFKP